MSSSDPCKTKRAEAIGCLRTAGYMSEAEALPAVATMLGRSVETLSDLNDQELDTIINEIRNTKGQQQ